MITIDERFNGPDHVANGGYACGVFARLVDGPAEVQLRNPVPLGTAVTVTRPDGTDEPVRVMRGDELLAVARPSEPLGLDLPEAPSPDAAKRAERRCRSSSEGIFSHCFVCGKARIDGFNLRPGLVDPGQILGPALVASTWTPPQWTDDGSGFATDELVQAVLDCPTYFAAYSDRDELPIAFLASQRARHLKPVPVGEDLVVGAWPIGQNGRKSWAGSAVWDANGEPLATSLVLMIEPQSDDSADAA